MTQTPDDLIGKVVLGRYRIVRVLARGGMGVIYLARSEGAAGFVKPVVVKRVLAEIGTDETMVKLFKREARIMSNLRHPAIVSVIDFGRDPQGYLMVLDYVHGFHVGRWWRYVKAIRGPFPIELAIHILVQVLDALHYAHTLTGPDGASLQVVHRDVSPSNILVDVEGHVKLADFGIARMRTEATEVRTGETTIKGKFPYLAPELFQSMAPTPQTDVYACGVVLHEIIVGHNEFRTKDVMTTVARVLEHIPARLEENRDDVPAGMSDVVLRAVAKKPEDRFASAADFATALRGVRRWTVDDAQAEIMRAVAHDFNDPRMAKLLGIDDLGALERAWREAPDSGPRADDSEPPPPIPVGGEDRARVVPELHTMSQPTISDPRIARPRARSRVWIPIAIVAVAIAGGAAAALFANAKGASSAARGIVVIRERDTPPIDEGEIDRAAVDPTTAAADDSGADDSGPADARGPNVERGPRKQPQVPLMVRLSRVFAQREPALRACYERHASEIHGSPRIEFRFEVTPEGQVETAQVRPAALGATALGGCLQRVARETRFGHLSEPVRSFLIPITIRVHSD